MDPDHSQNKKKLILGDDLYGLSVHELEQRIDACRAEITRLKIELTKKTAERSAADALFGKTT